MRNRRLLSTFEFPGGREFGSEILRISRYYGANATSASPTPRLIWRMLNPNDHTLSGLVRLHAELGRKISENRREAATLAQAMKHVEAVIRLLDADFNISK